MLSLGCDNIKHLTTNLGGVGGLVGVKSRNNASVELNLLTETGTVLGNSLLQKISLFLKHITW